MPKNILIFSDGTGQAGGITFDEDRTNIYKLYRATRCSPDSCINPDEQVAFYDPGLGSPGNRGFMFGTAGRWIYNTASQATGLGLTANIVDCYAALIRLYRDGDRIFLFGFSRGAYTVRSLAALIAKCGIPRQLPNNRPVPLDVAGPRKIADYAVRHVYQFCSSRPRTKKASYRNFLLDTRELVAQRFRREHGSFNPQDPAKANVYPYFIGVFDTVAALGRPAAVIFLSIGFVLLIAALSLAISLLSALSTAPYVGWLLAYLKFEYVFSAFSAATVLVGLYALLQTYVKFDFRVPGYGPLKSLATFHFAPPKHKFYDYYLDVNVEYAKHAISIDENRKDFQRVRWYPTAAREGTRDKFGNIYFEQVWFAGVHADVGGGYPENESRLSDITLRWMLAAASIVPDGIKHDERVLCLYPDSAGPQHDEVKAGRWQRAIRQVPYDDRTGISQATMHKSVYERFDAGPVVHYDVLTDYRPVNLSNHADFRHYYDTNLPKPAARVAVADDIEAKWERRMASGQGRSE
jgi:uncharacterized protein (DUF2235 family)